MVFPHSIASGLLCDAKPPLRMSQRAPRWRTLDEARRPWTPRGPDGGHPAGRRSAPSACQGGQGRPRPPSPGPGRFRPPRIPSGASPDGGNSAATSSAARSWRTPRRPSRHSSGFSGVTGGTIPLPIPDRLADRLPGGPDDACRRPGDLPSLPSAGPVLPSAGLRPSERAEVADPAAHGLLRALRDPAATEFRRAGTGRAGGARERRRSESRANPVPPPFPLVFREPEESDRTVRRPLPW
jgi:hypothetical protein